MLVPRGTAGWVTQGRGDPCAMGSLTSVVCVCVCVCVSLRVQMQLWPRLSGCQGTLNM